MDTRVYRLIPFVLVMSEAQNLSGACENGDLFVKIPYPNAVTSDDILHFKAGECETWRIAEGEGASLSYNNEKLLREKPEKDLS